MNRIKTLLIANRGEIACRIIKTAKSLNIKTIAIYAEPEKDALHCQLADVAYCVGPIPVEKSYLNSANIIRVALEAKADAIHPGYGFLSENAQFALACQTNGLIFVGPSSEAIASMAVKDQAKDLMSKAKVPIVPGYMGKAQDNNSLAKAANEIGYPIMLKAAKGGGGKGMRVVKSASELFDAIEAAKRESLNSFGDDTLFIEKYLTQARHIEVQIFRDLFGNVVHLFERDCSLQRRHQKIIESSPAIGIGLNIKQQLYQAAINAANAIDYHGAGTIEFLYQDEQFYFMEMNTRLQVEHPVTEMVTGLDLVEWQLIVSDGQPLPLTQTQITSTGHAIEARIYAEDPYNGFLPASGKIKAMLLPTQVDYRLDLGVRTGDTIHIYFDPLIAKLIVHAKDNMHAVQDLMQVLKHMHVVGLNTNLPFLRNILKDKIFQSGVIYTDYLGNNLDKLLPKPLFPQADVLAMLVMVILLERNAEQSNTRSPWAQCNAWRLNLPYEETILVRYGQEELRFVVVHPKEKNGFYQISITPERNLLVKANLDHNEIQATFDTHETHAHFYSDQKLIELFSQGQTYVFQRKTFVENSQQIDLLSHALVAPMPGIISKIWVKAGEKVNKGAKLIALEAMKMEHTVYSAEDGLIKAIHYQIGEQVEEGSELIDFE